MNFLVKTCDYDRMNSERTAARTFVALGSVVWVVLFVGAYFYWSPDQNVGPVQIVLPLALALLALGLGWFYERLAAIALFVGGAAAIVWGIVMGWESGVWGLMGLLLIAPTFVAGLLFLLAAETQAVCELDEGGK